MSPALCTPQEVQFRDQGPQNAGICLSAIRSLPSLPPSTNLQHATLSACSSGSLDPSHVLLAIGLPEEKAHGSIRFTFGKDTTQEDVDYTVEKLVAIIENLRAMSPLFAEIKGGQKYV